MLNKQPGEENHRFDARTSTLGDPTPTAFRHGPVQGAIPCVYTSVDGSKASASATTACQLPSMS